MYKATFISALAWLAACGGETPPAQSPEAPPPETPAAKTGLRMRSELGTVDPAAVRQTFSSLDDKFSKCQESGIDRVELLAGQVKFFLRIADDGSAKWAYIEDSELGDRATEKCLIAVVMEARWPKPDGGDAEARYSMDLPLQATRPPNEWSSDRLAGALARSSSAIDSCKGTSATFHATVYVGPGGHVLSAGVSAPTKDDEAKADCLAEVLRKLKGLPSPGSWPAKVSFRL
jgi:hypothetical protein